MSTLEKCLGQDKKQKNQHVPHKFHKLNSLLTTCVDPKSGHLPCGGPMVHNKTTNLYHPSNDLRIYIYKDMLLSHINTSTTFNQVLVVKPTITCTMNKWVFIDEASRRPRFSLV